MNPNVLCLAAQKISGGGSSVAAWGSSTVWDPSRKSPNLRITAGVYLDATSYGGGTALATVGNNTGVWAYEATISPITGICALGVGSYSVSLSYYPGYNSEGIGWHYNGNVYLNNSSIATPGTFASGDVIGVVLDHGSDTLKFYKNGVLKASVSLGPLGSTTLYPAANVVNTGSMITANFGATAFAYTY